MISRLTWDWTFERYIRPVSCTLREASTQHFIESHLVHQITQISPTAAYNSFPLSLRQLHPQTCSPNKPFSHSFFSRPPTSPELPHMPPRAVHSKPATHPPHPSVTYPPPSQLSNTPSSSTPTPPASAPIAAWPTSTLYGIAAA